jgi:hypothetical protein
MLLAAKVWFYWIAVIFTLLVGGGVAAIVFGYWFKVTRNKHPR